MNLKSLFLIVSCVTFSNIHCAYLDHGTTESNIPTNLEQPKQKITAFLTPLEENQAHLSEHEKPTEASQPTPSTFLTTIWYGAARHVGKQTALGIFKELNQKGTLKADYKTNRTEAFNRLNTAAAERFTQKDLLTPKQQEKIADLFSTATAIDSEFALAKALAAQYYILQKEAVEQTLCKQANEIEPQLREKRNNIIQQAEQEYIADLAKELTHGRDAASNSRYLYKRAEIQDAFNYQDENHYRNIESFSQLLQKINPAVEIANETNLHHLPKAPYKTN